MIIYDSAFVTGVSCLVYAAYQVHPALAWAVAGASLIAFGWLGARKLLSVKDRPSGR